MKEQISVLISKDEVEERKYRTYRGNGAGSASCKT